MDGEKPLTVAQLNYMFNEKQDVFEFQTERADWKYPKHVKVQKSKSNQQFELAYYNELNVTGNLKTAA